MPPIQRPEIPDATFRISDYGAKGDGTTDNSTAIQSAIDAAAAAGGGRVVIPEGRFLSGPIALRSKIDLHLEKGAVLLMSQNMEDFPAGRNDRQDFLRAKNCQDIRISGPGTIDGQGQPWWSAYLDEKAADEDGLRRPQLIGIEDCERIELDGFTSQDPPNTHCSLRRSRDVTIRNLTMIAPDASPNTDGLNLSIVQNASISRCDISTGDDNVVLLASSPADDGGPGVRNITVRDCKFGFGHGLSIGSYTAGGIENVDVGNISFDGTTSGIRMKSARDRGGRVRNLAYKNITIKNVRYPIYIASYYPKPPVYPEQDGPPEGDKIPEWSQIQIENVTITDSKNSIILWGLPDGRISDVTLKNVQASAEAGAVAFHASAVFADVQITSEDTAPLRTYDAEITGMDSVPFEGRFKAK